MCESTHPAFERGRNAFRKPRNSADAVLVLIAPAIVKNVIGF
jgi:hypothetical protein